MSRTGKTDRKASEPDISTNNPTNSVKKEAWVFLLERGLETKEDTGSVVIMRLTIWR